MAQCTFDGLNQLWQHAKTQKARSIVLVQGQSKNVVKQDKSLETSGQGSPTLGLSTHSTKQWLT
jgi:hypothetical protein